MSSPMTLVHRLRRLFLERNHVCPWWLGYSFDNPLRRPFHDPKRIFKGLLLPGQTALDMGCGMGYFTLGMAGIVGKMGKVIAADVQERMLRIVWRRARRKGMENRIQPHLCEPARIGIAGPIDFALAFWMVHETPDPAKLFAELTGILRPGALLLVAEPAVHVSARRFQSIVEAATAKGLRIWEPRKIAFSHALLFRRS